MGLYSDRMVEKPRVSSQVTVRGRTVRASEHDDRRRDRDDRDSPERRPRRRDADDLRNRLGNRLEARKQQPSRHVLDRLGGRPGDSGRPSRGRGGARGGRGDDRGDRGDREDFAYFQHDDRKGTAKAVLQATLEGDYTGDAVDRHKDGGARPGRNQAGDRRAVRGRGAVMERTNNRRGRGGDSWQHDMYDEDEQARSVHDRLGGMDMED